MPKPKKCKPADVQYGQNRVEIEKRFTYHSPKDDQPKKYEELRDCASVLADLIDAHVPESREKALAFTNLEAAIMWANAGIVRRS